MSWKATKHLLVASIMLGAAGSAGAQSTNPTPTCSDAFEDPIAVHGEHVIGDYVTGIGHDTFEWTPSGGIVGETVSANGGVAIRGGPGPGFHFEHGVAPGASFCTDSQSPGWPHD